MRKSFNAMVERHEVTNEEINDFINNSIVKFIFFDKNLSDISSDKTINEIHKFKSKYRGNTYISVPIKTIQGENDKYIRGLEVDESENPTAFVVVSKHDLRDLSPEMKKASANERALYGEKLCVEYLSKLNKMLNNELLHLTITDEKGDVVVSEDIKGNYDAINHYISHKISDINKESTEIV